MAWKVEILSEKSGRNFGSVGHFYRQARGEDRWDRREPLYPRGQRAHGPRNPGFTWFGVVPARGWGAS